MICKLCCGSPDIDLFIIERTDEERWVCGGRSNIVRVDVCIGREVKKLIELGVKTVGCCCGHGEMKPTCLVLKSSKDILIENDYMYKEFDDKTLVVDLKTDVKQELLDVLKSKPCNYINRQTNNM